MWGPQTLNADDDDDDECLYSSSISMTRIKDRLGSWGPARQAGQDLYHMNNPTKGLIFKNT